MSAYGQNVQEIGKDGDAPEPPKVSPLTSAEIQGDWKAEKIGDNESPVGDLYIHFDEGGSMVAEGRYKDWKADKAGDSGEITFKRKPKAEEMSAKAPPWAREKIAAEGKLEWRMTLKAESRKGEWVIEGKWYPGQFKWNETGEGADAKQEATYLDEGKPVDVKFKKAPVIVGTFVLNNQTGWNNGRPWHPYPHIPRPKGIEKRKTYALLPYAGEGDSRTLFVYGVNLPTNYDKKIDVRGKDNTITYSTIVLGSEKNLGPDRQRLLKAGWDAALKGLKPETAKTVRKCAAMLVRADLGRGVTAGVKRFTLNDASDCWRLRFGDDSGLITFARDVTAEENEDIDCAYAPEKIYIEIRTETPSLDDEIHLRVRLNDKDITWNGADAIVAKYLKDIPTPQAYEVPRPGEPSEVVPKVIRVYRTPAIQLGGDAPPGGKGYRLNVKAEDVLMVKPEDPFLFTFRPPVATVKIWDAPDRDSASNLVTTWPEAVQRAAFLDGLGDQVKAGKNVTGKQAGTISNVIILKKPLKRWSKIADKLSSSNTAADYAKAGLAVWAEINTHWLAFNPVMLPWRYAFNAFDDPPDMSEHVIVTVSDHAALLLYKEAFIRKMSIGLGGLEKKTFIPPNPLARRAMLLGLRELLKVSATKEGSPWESIRVPGPAGGDVKFSWALDDGLRKTACTGMSDSAADEWSLNAVENGLGQYKDAIRHAIQKAKDTPDNDLNKLLELIGYGYENLAPELMQRMMWHPPTAPGPKWEPDLNARYALWNLHTAADAVRAQEDLSKLDTQMVILIASAYMAPLMVVESLPVMAACYAFDSAVLTGQLISETIPELWEAVQREEIKFAVGASLVLGLDRLREAELKKTQWFETVLNVLPAAMGATFGGAQLREFARLDAKTNAALVGKPTERHGLEGARRLTNPEKAALLIHASEGAMLKEMGAAKVLEVSHENAMAVVEKLAVEAGVELKPPQKITPRKVNATGSGAAEELKPLSAEGKPGKDPFHKADVERTPLVKEEVPPPLDPNQPASGPVAKPKPAPPAAPPGKTPRILRTADDFRGVLVTQAGTNQRPLVAKGTQIRVRVNGELVDLALGEPLGGGGFAGVWEIADGPAKYKGKAVKLTFLDRGEVFRVTAAGQDAPVAEFEKLSHLGYKEDVDAASEILSGRNKTGTQFEHAAIRATGADENVACVIQDRIRAVAEPSLAQEGDCLILKVDEFVRYAPKNGLDDAVVELFWELTQAGVAWEDCKLSNMYFRKKGGKWLAGIIDVDRVYLYADRSGRRGSFLDWVEAVNAFRISYDGKTPNVRSLRNSTTFPWIHEDYAPAAYFVKRTDGAIPGPYFKDLEEFMMIMFEYHAWIGHDPASRKFYKRLISPDVIQKQIFPGHTEPLFPKLNDDARFKPRDLSTPYLRGASIRALPFFRYLASVSKSEVWEVPDARSGRRADRASCSRGFLLAA
jgi:hypothetical protein